MPLEQFGVERGDTVHVMAADRGQMRHSHLAFSTLIDKRDARDQRVVIREFRPHFGEEAAIDLIDDFQMAGSNAGHQMHAPALERLGKQCVIGIGKSVAGDLPGALPFEAMLVDEQTHHLGDRDCGMGVIELECQRGVQFVERFSFVLLDTNHILQRAGDKKELLFQAELLAGSGCIIRVEDLGNSL